MSVLSLGIFYSGLGFCVCFFVSGLMISNVTIFFLLGFTGRASSSQICQMNNTSCASN